MKKRSDYIARVSKGISIYKAMEALEDNGTLMIKYGEKTYEIHCSIYEHSGQAFSIGEDKLFGSRMNIDLDKSGKSYLYCYTYDLFSTKTIAKLNFDNITIVK